MQTWVTDYSYVLKIQEAIKKTTSDFSDELKHLLTCDRMQELNRCFFYPELSFDWRVYKQMRKFLKNTANFDIVCRMTDRKFLKFVQWPILFWTYTRVYNYLFKIKRLHGKTRKVLR